MIDPLIRGVGRPEKLPQSRKIRQSKDPNLDPSQAMKMTKPLIQLLAVATCALLSPAAIGAITVTFTEQTTGVAIRMTGIVDDSGLNQVSSGGPGSGFNLISQPDFLEFIASESGSGKLYRTYSGADFTNFSQFGTFSIFGSTSDTSVFTGDDLPLVSVVNEQLSFDDVYRNQFIIGGPPVDASAFFPNQNFQSMALQNGQQSTVSWVSNSGPESVTFQAVSAIPEPSFWATVGLFLLLAGFFRQRNRRCEQRA